MRTDLFQQQTESWYSSHNPLLVGLPRFTEISEIVDKLAFNPLSGIDLNSLGIVERDALLVGEKVPLEPTTQSVRAAMTWWGMLDTGLRARNPVLPAARRQYWLLINAVAQGADTIPQTPTRGMAIHVVKGPTGTGKSVTAQRFCMLLPQVLDRAKDEAAGWISLRQLVYLEVMVSHDGTRGGFLLGILFQMDRALGTTYAIDLPKRFRTIEKLAVATVGRLVAHFTGILFVDEGQIRNLIESGQAELMQMFLLLLMNSGIPLVLIGNEKAFDWVTYSQDKSRLYINPPEIFSPIGAIDHSNVENEWDSVATGIIGYYVLLKQISNPKECSKMLRRCSGGIARLALILWCAAQREKLLCGEESIGPDDILRAYQSPAFDAIRSLAEGFHYRKPELLMIYPDVDAHFYARHWGVPLAKSEDTQSALPGGPNQIESQNTANKAPRKRTNEKAKFASEQTRKRKQKEKREELSRLLSPDDVRKQGLVNIQLTGLTAARAATQKKDG